MGIASLRSTAKIIIISEIYLPANEKIVTNVIQRSVRDFPMRSSENLEKTVEKEGSSDDLKTSQNKVKIEGKPYHRRPQIWGKNTFSVLAHSFLLQ